MSVFVKDTKEMGLGELDTSVQQLEGAISEVATAMSQGRMPNIAGGGEFISDVASNLMMSGAAGPRVGAGALSEGPSSSDPFSGGHGGRSNFLSARGARNLNALGIPMSYSEKKQLTRQETKDFVRRVQGRPPLNPSGDVLSARAVSPISGRPRQPVKVTREMVINLCLVPSEIVSSLGAVRQAQQMPGEAQIVKSLGDGDARGETLLAKSSAQVQDKVNEKAKRPKLKTPKPPQPAGLQPPQPNQATRS